MVIALQTWLGSLRWPPGWPPAWASGARLGRAPTRLTIRRKIALAYCVTASITAGLGAYAVHDIGVTGGLMTTTFDQVLMSLDYARAASSDFATLQTAMIREQVSGVAADPSIDALAIQVRDDVRIAGERALSDGAGQAAAAADAALTAWMSAAPLRLDGVVAWAALDRQAGVMNDSLDQLVNIAAGDGFLHRQSARALVLQSRIVDGSATVLTVLMAALVASWLCRQIMGPVGAASAAARRIAAGEWTARIPLQLTQGRDELGALLAAMETMRANIEAMMSREVAMRRVAQVRLADAIGTSPEGVLVTDAAGAVVVANPRLVALFPGVAAGLTGTP